MAKSDPDLTKSPIVILLSAVVAAFCSGVTAFIFLQTQLESATRNAVKTLDEEGKLPHGPQGPAGPSVRIIRVPIQIYSPAAKRDPNSIYGQVFDAPYEVETPQIVRLKPDESRGQILNAWCVPHSGLVKFQLFHRLEVRLANDGTIELFARTLKDKESQDGPGRFEADIYVAYVEKTAMTGSETGRTKR
jgi:hypothetical protein